MIFRDPHEAERSKLALGHVKWDTSVGDILEIGVEFGST